MFTNRLFNLMIAAAVVAVVALTVQEVLAKRAIVPETAGVYTESKEQMFRDAQLGERYGQLPPHIAGFTGEQIHREYILGERYGVTPQRYVEQPAPREFWLGERYGQTQ